MKNFKENPTLSNKERKNINQMQSKITENIDWKEQLKELSNLVNAIENAGLQEFAEYIRSPWRMLWPNFVAGIARWVGTLVGAAAVLAIIGWILTRMISLPLIGSKLEPYINQVQNEITKYTESTNYNDNFQNIEKVMTEIRDEIKKQNTTLWR